MMESEKEFFCGGLFFGLLLEARRPRKSKRAAMKSGSDRMAETDVMSGLIDVVCLSSEAQDGRTSYKYEDTFVTSTSKYKSCKNSGGADLPFNDTATLQSFDMKVRGSYQTVLRQMMDFVSCFIAKEKMEWLVKALLDVLLRDEGIKETDTLFVSGDGCGVIKSDIFNLPSIEFQPFLLGVLHYVLINRRDNTIGQQKFGEWYQSAGKRRPKKYAGDLGAGIDQIPPIKWLDSSTIKEPEKEPKDLGGQPLGEETSGECASPKEEDTESSQTNIQTQIINNPTIVNQHGVNNLHINQLETLIL